MNASQIAQAGAGVKNFAIGAGIIVIGIALIYFSRKISDLVGKSAEAVKDSADYVLGQSNDSSLGSDLFGVLNSAPSSYDEQQAIKSCNIQWARYGEVRGDICNRLKAEGKLTPP